MLAEVMAAFGFRQTALVPKKSNKLCFNPANNAVSKPKAERWDFIFRFKIPIDVNSK